jgi:hypothetical protein
MIVIV